MTNKSDVIYKDIPNYEGIYQVSNYGDVKRITHWVKNPVLNSGGYFLKERPLKKIIDNRGYYKVYLCKEGVSKQAYVHRLVFLLAL